LAMALGPKNLENQLALGGIQYGWNGSTNHRSSIPAAGAGREGLGLGTERRTRGHWQQ
jgi:hypothetical protein